MGKAVYIDGGTEACGTAAYISSSLWPNADAVRETLDGEVGISIVSSKPIAVDEEITIFYLGKEPVPSKLKILKVHRYVSIKDYDKSGVNRSFVCCNRTVWPPANGHKPTSHICSECSRLAKQPVGYCCQWCFDQHIYALCKGDKDQIAATSARRKAHNTKTYQF